MREEYFNWLYRLVCASTRPDASFSMMLRALHRKEFYSLIPNDDNRGVEGQTLREEFRFCERPDLPPNWHKAPSSVFEMLIALAKRMEFTLIGSEIEADWDKWFWEMIQNLGLDNLTDDRFDRVGGEGIVDEVLDNLLERKYGPDGKGGLFPLKHPRLDQREVEIWYQKEYYAGEKLDYIS